MDPFLSAKFSHVLQEPRPGPPPRKVPRRGEHDGENAEKTSWRPPACGPGSRPRLRGRCTEKILRLAKSAKIHAPLEIEGKTRQISAKIHHIFFDARRPCHARGFARARWESSGRGLGELWESSGRALGELWGGSGRALRTYLGRMVNTKKPKI